MNVVQNYHAVSCGWNLFPNAG